MRDARFFQCPVLAALLATGLLFLAVANAQARELDVRSAILFDLSHGAIQYQKDADDQIPPASLTKIMTMFLVYDAVAAGQAHMYDVVSVSQAAADTGGSSMHLTAGEEVTLLELMKGMAVSSGNDACVAVAEHIAGDVASFVAMMNAKAQMLRMTNTIFKNPNGLPAEGQLTTARDMLKLAVSYLLTYPNSLQLHSMTSFTHNGITRNNSNKLLGNCEGVDGLKTGYVNASGYNLIVTAKRDDTRIVAVLLGADSPKIRLKESRLLVEAGFEWSKTSPAASRVVTAAAQEQDMESGSQEYVARDLAAFPVTGVYSLQESSWDEEAKARARAESLREEGMEVWVEVADLGERGVWFRVLIGAFETLVEAKQFKQTLSRTHNIHHAFVLRVDAS